MVCHGLHLITSMLRTLLPFLALLAVTLQAQEPKQWFKGNTHTHTLWSDGNDFPEMVVDWYQRHGYQFLAISDHNVIHAKEVWMAETAIASTSRPAATRTPKPSSDSAPAATDARMSPQGSWQDHHAKIPRAVWARLGAEA